MHRSVRFTIATALAIGLVGCDSDPEVDSGVDTGTDTSSMADVPEVDANIPLDVPPQPDAPLDTPPGSCPAESARDTVNVMDPVSADAHWTCEHNYLLVGGPVFVQSGVTVTVDPGVVVRGEVRDGTRACVGGAMAGSACTADGMCAGGECGPPAELGTALVVQRGGRLVANGTASEPIVFTSENTGTATEPAPGNWGGIVLLGAAPTNNVPADGAQIEGLPTDGRGAFGGADAAHSCGELSYVRIEYAGFVFGRNNELNGLTVGGCGTGTLLHHIQSHRGLDDGIEFFGGTVNIHHALVTGTGDDSLDWDLGWTGNVQFYLAQQRDVPGEERCIEGDNHPSLFAGTPRTSPTVYNFTCIGAGNAPGVTEVRRATLAHDGVVLRRGSAGTIRNSIFYGSPDRGIQIDDQETGTPAAPPAESDTVQLVTMGVIHIENNILFDIGDTGAEAVFTSDPLRVGGVTTMDGSAIVAALLAANRSVDPMFGGDPNNATNPDFSPSATVVSVAANLSAEPTTPAGFFEDVDYAGAVDPDATAATAWYAGWARFTD